MKTLSKSFIVISFLGLAFTIPATATVDTKRVVTNKQTAKTKQVIRNKQVKQTRKTNQNRRVAQSAGKSGTVGDMLKNIYRDDRGQNVQMTKSSTALPRSNDSAFLRGEEPKLRNLETIKPPRTSSFYGEADRGQAELEKVTDESISELYKLTEKFKRSKNRGEIWLRLAELYVEKARIIEFRKQAEYDKSIKAWLEKKRGPRPQIDLSDAQDYNKKAIQLYEWFIRDFPNDSKIDQALFFLGYNHFEVGNLRIGENYYKQLTQKFPNSPYVSEANFALGEYYFENEKWQSAYNHYMEVVKLKKARLYTFSVYKSAWCLFRLGKPEIGLKYMRSIVGGNKNSGGGDFAGNKALDRLRLEKEALRDLVVFYGEAGSYENAVAYFQNLAGKDEATPYLEKLAYYYSDKGDRQGARHIFKELIAEHPTSPKAFEYQYQIVTNYAYASKTKIFHDELWVWINDYSKDSSWGRANLQNKSVIDEAAEKREKTLRTYILQQHETAQNSHASFSQQTALQGYRLYIKEFSDSSHIGEMRFFYAELLFDMNSFDTAAREYRWVVDNTSEAKYKQKAAINAILALEKSLPTDQQILARVGKSTNAIPLDEKSDRFKEGADWFFAKYPTSEKLTQIKFRLGRLYYLHNHYDEAAAIFHEIVKNDPKSQYAEYSANLLLDIYNIKKDYANLEKTGKELLAIPQLAKGKVGGDIRNIMEKSSFKRAQDLESGKNYAQSAAEFSHFAQQNPQSPLAGTAQFNSAVNYEKSKDFPQAIAMYSAVLASRNPKDENLKKKARKQVAVLYQEIGDYENAAKSFQSLAREMPNDSAVSNYHYNAAVIWEGMNKYESAINEFESFAKTGKKSDYITYYYEAGEMNRKRKRPQEEINYFEKLLAQPGVEPDRQIEATYKICQAYHDLANADRERQWRQKTIDLQRKLSSGGRQVGAHEAAQARTEQILENAREFEVLKIPTNPKSQQVILQKKLAMLNSLRGELAQVIRYDDPSGIVAALTIAGQANEHMVQAIEGVPLPKGLTDEEMKEYKAGIEKLVSPIREEARKSYQSAVEKALQFDVYERWFEMSKAGLARVDSSQLPKTDERGLLTSEVDWMGLK